MPPLLAVSGYPCLSLNMRDHDQAEPRDFELAHHDLGAGVDYLAAQNGGEIVLLAHGFACNKVACYAASSQDRIPRRTILTTPGAAKAYRPEIWAAALRRGEAARRRASRAFPPPRYSHQQCRRHGQARADGRDLGGGLARRDRSHPLQRLLLLPGGDRADDRPARRTDRQRRLGRRA